MTVNELIDLLNNLPDEWKNDQVICFHEVDPFLNKLKFSEEEINKDKESDDMSEYSEYLDFLDDLNDSGKLDNIDDLSKEDKDKMMSFMKGVKPEYSMGPVETVSRIFVSKNLKNKNLFEIPLGAIFLE